jgi:hypothetical protein
MPPTPFQIDPERPLTKGEAAPPETREPESAERFGANTETPLTFVPHEAGRAPVRIRTNRYGEMEEHELIRLLDTIEDERARGRFRESIYISVFIWLAIAWVVFYGPRYLWHAPQLISPADVMKQRAMVQLNNPVLPRVRPPAPKPVDNGTLAKLRAETKLRAEAQPKAAPPAPSTPAPAAAVQPAPVAAAPPPLPSAPTPVTPRMAPPVVDAPTPQAPTRPNFSTGGTAADQLRSAIEGSAGGRGGVPGISGHNAGSALGSGAEILSDTQGVNFQPYLARIMRETYEQWIPLIPEEARPPLMKQGYTALRITIMADGTIHVQDGVHNGLVLENSSHDEALDRAAWGSITGVGQFPPLPPQFHGPDLELRIHYLVNEKQ